MTSGFAFRALAVDYDGTLTMDDVPNERAMSALREARRAGLRVILVTGRIMSELRRSFPDVDACFDVIVAENGAVIDGVRGQQLLAAPVDTALVEALIARGVDARRGEALVACEGVESSVVMDEVHRLRLDCQVLYNRASLMVLPAGVTKGTGLEAALELLGLSVHSAIGIGDAENDHALLQSCEFGAAVANAVESLKFRADMVMQRPNGDGVTELVHSGVLSGDVPVRSARRSVLMGTFADGSTVTLPTSHANVLMTGATRSGKSFVGGLFAERVIHAGYTVMVIDYEGDHVGLEALRGVVLLGGHHHLPDPHEVCAIIGKSISVVIDLSLMTLHDQDAYVASLEGVVTELRTRTGLPDWLMIDEAHRSSPGLLRLAQYPQRGCCLITWTPERLPAEVSDRFDFVLVVNSPSGSGSASLLESARDPTPLAFTLLDRESAHVRHWHKYADGDLPEHHRFYFRRRSGAVTGQVASSLREFEFIVGQADDDVLQHHLTEHDFSRWVLNVVHDAKLAVLVAEIEAGFGIVGDIAVTRARLIDAVRQRY